MNEPTPIAVALLAVSDARLADLLARLLALRRSGSNRLDYALALVRAESEGRR